MPIAHLYHALSASLTLVLVSTALASESSELIQRGDVFYARLQPAEALKYYLPAEKLEPANARLLVRISRQYRHLMSEAKIRDEKVPLGTTAVAYAKRAVALAPDDPEAQLALAISYAKMLPFESNRQQFENSRLIKTAADRVIALDPGNDLGWQVLGRWYFGVASLSAVKRSLAQVVYGKMPVGRFEDAVRCYRKAIELNPNRLMHYIELGRTYAQMGRVSEARSFLNKGLAMPDTEKDDPQTKALGREVLAKLR